MPRFSDASEWLSYWITAPRIPAERQRILERYYQSYVSHFGPYLRRHYISQISELENEVARNPGCRVLEIGCGCGTESLWLGLQGASVVGIDLDRDRLEVARARLAHTKRDLGLRVQVEYEQMSVFQATRYGTFDVVWMEQTFHHIEPRMEFLRLLKSLVKPGGSFVISEANALNPLLQLQLIGRRGFKTLRKYTDSSGRTHLYGNERITTAGSLSRQLASVGFRVMSVRHFRVLPNVAWADRFGLLESFVPGWFKPGFTHFNLVAEHVPSSSTRSSRSDGISAA